MVMNAAQAAERAGIQPSTVSRWVQSGRLAAGRLPTPGSCRSKTESLTSSWPSGRPRRGRGRTPRSSWPSDRSESEGSRRSWRHSARGSMSLRHGCGWSFRLSTLSTTSTSSAALVEVVERVNITQRRGGRQGGRQPAGEQLSDAFATQGNQTPAGLDVRLLTGSGRIQAESPIFAVEPRNPTR